MSFDLNRIKYWITAGLILLLTLFIMQNAAPVEIHFLHWTVESRRSIIVGGSLLIGILIGWLFGRGRRLW